MALPTTCQEKTGFLIMHKCPNAADSKCGVCGKYICSKHTHIHAAAPICEKCLQKAAPQEYTNAMRSRGMGYSHYYGYEPFFYRGYHHRDYEHFDRAKSDSFHEDEGGS